MTGDFRRPASRGRVFLGGLDHLDVVFGDVGDDVVHATSACSSSVKASTTARCRPRSPGRPSPARPSLRRTSSSMNTRCGSVTPITTRVPASPSGTTRLSLQYSTPRRCRCRSSMAGRIHPLERQPRLRSADGALDRRLVHAHADQHVAEPLAAGRLASGPCRACVRICAASITPSAEQPVADVAGGRRIQGCRIRFGQLGLLIRPTCRAFSSTAGRCCPRRRGSRGATRSAPPGSCPADRAP
jgi:hypothetical protein